MLATVGTSAQTLVAATSGCPSSVPNFNAGLYLQAHPDNVGNIHFSTRSDVTTNGALTCGFILAPGQWASPPLDMAKDASQIYVIATQSGQFLIWDNTRMGS